MFLLEIKCKMKVYSKYCMHTTCYNHYFDRLSVLMESALWMTHRKYIYFQSQSTSCDLKWEIKLICIWCAFVSLSMKSRWSGHLFDLPFHFIYCVVLLREGQSHCDLFLHKALDKGVICVITILSISCEMMRLCWLGISWANLIIPLSLL